MGMSIMLEFGSEMTIKMRSTLSRICTVGIVVGLVLTFGTRWIYLEVLGGNTRYGIVCGMILCCGIVMVMVGAACGVIVGLIDVFKRNQVRQQRD